MTSAHLTDRLKEATRDLHDAVEQTPVNRAFFSGQMTPEILGQALQRYLSVFKPLEERLARQGLAPQLQYVQRWQDIVEDLENLGVSGTNPASPFIDFEIETDGEALGVLYVLEGSRSGGPIIAKQLMRYDGLSDYTRFFAPAEMKAVQANWQGFKDRMNARAAGLGPDGQAAALDTAGLTFKALIATFDDFRITENA